MRKSVLGLGLGGALLVLLLFLLIYLAPSFWGCGYFMDYVRSQRLGSPQKTGVFIKGLCSLTPFGLPLGVGTLIYDTPEDVPTINQVKDSTK